MSIQLKTGYVATVADIRQLVLETLSAESALFDGSLTYLKALAGTTIKEAGGDPRHPQSRRGRRKPLSKEDTAKQLSCLEAVHTRFYEAATAVVSESIGRGPGSAKELNRRTNRYRTAMSAIRRWLRAGNDLLTINVVKLTKDALEVERGVRLPSVPRLRKRLEARSKQFIAALLELAEVDKAAALGEVELTMGVLAQQAVLLGGTPVTNPRRAMQEHRPLRAGGRVFVPVTESQVIRQQARPS